MLNRDINKEIVKAKLRGYKSEELKTEYIRRNAFDVSVDSDAYRIFQSQYFLEDVEKSEITLVNIHPLVFGDPLENPLLNRQFMDETGELLTLNGIIEDYFGLSWTEEAQDEDWRWKDFTHGKLGVRVKVRIEDLLRALTNVNDPFFMLHYFIGKVTYHGTDEIEHWASTSHYTDFLDSLGQTSVMTLMKLRRNFDDEKEIRLLYSYMPNDNVFVKQQIKVSGRVPHRICKHPINWEGIGDEVLVDPRMPKQDFQDYKARLKDCGLSCDILRSSVTI